jgi:hypothetical protein
MSSARVTELGAETGEAQDGRLGRRVGRHESRAKKGRHTRKSDRDRWHGVSTAETDTCVLTNDVIADTLKMIRFTFRVMSVRVMSICVMSISATFSDAEVLRF